MVDWGEKTKSILDGGDSDLIAVSTEVDRTEIDERVRNETNSVRSNQQIMEEELRGWNKTPPFSAANMIEILEQSTPETREDQAEKLVNYTEENAKPEETRTYRVTAILDVAASIITAKEQPLNYRELIQIQELNTDQSDYEASYSSMRNRINYFKNRISEETEIKDKYI